MTEHEGAERAPELIAWAVQWLRLEADDRESGMRFENKDARATITKLHAAADAIADLSRAPAKFDAMVPAQEELAIKFCHEIAGPRGKKGSAPDPVRLLEMAEALYRAEIGSVTSRAPALAEELKAKDEKIASLLNELRERNTMQDVIVRGFERQQTALAEECERLRDVLETYQWVSGPSGSFCPACKKSPSAGHWELCEIRAALSSTPAAKMNKTRLKKLEAVFAAAKEWCRQHGAPTDYTSGAMKAVWNAVQEIEPTVPFMRPMEAPTLPEGDLRDPG